MNLSRLRIGKRLMKEKNNREGMTIAFTDLIPISQIYISKGKIVQKEIKTCFRVLHQLIDGYDFSYVPACVQVSTTWIKFETSFWCRGAFFLSARIVGFYTNLFGHRTKFFFLWEDIDEIQVLPPSLASMGSAQLVIVLREGRGLYAKHGAKCQDEVGRLQFYFISFVSFNVASRTIMALWRTRTLTPDQKAQIAEEQQEDDGKSLLLEDTGSCLVVEDGKMSKVYTLELPVKMKSLMEMFDGGNLEHVVMGKTGCLSYVTTTWEPVKTDFYERRLCYKFNRQFSIFGGEVTCTQQKFPISNGKGWIVNEAMALHNIPFSDHFRVHFKYQFENCILSPSSSCKCAVYVGVTWLKTTKFQHRITRNITEKFTHRLKEIFELVEREILLTNSPI
ncbi:hypothetical protein ACSBR2_042258 [Camellia fascicularis]